MVRRTILVVALITAAAAVPLSAAGAAGQHNWTVYHHDAGGSGNAGAGVNLSAPSMKWTSPALDGELYGEPLVLGTSVFVATENDTVYGLSTATGAVLWRKHLAKPVPASSLPCGNITPTVGITSTPVIDPARSEIFVVADELVAGVPRHVLHGLSLSSGAVRLSQKVDPAGQPAAVQLQRASLTLDRGRVVFGYGGNEGDCGKYHGWVVSVPEGGGAMTTFEVDSAGGQKQGAVWMGGAAPVVDSQGDVWVATGNGSVTTVAGPYDHSDSVLELSPALRLKQFFAPTTWFIDNAGDLDLGSSVPAVLPNGLVVQAGKSRTLYVLDAAKLGGIGGQLTALSGFCGADVDGGVAFSGVVAYLPCQAGVEAVSTDKATGTAKVLWQTSTGASTPPIVAGGYVWSIAGGSLLGLDPANGAMRHQLPIGINATHFPTPSYGGGLLLAPAGDRVIAFS